MYSKQRSLDKRFNPSWKNMRNYLYMCDILVDTKL